MAHSIECGEILLPPTGTQPKIRFTKRVTDRRGLKVLDALIEIEMGHHSFIMHPEDLRQTIDKVMALEGGV